MIKQRERRKNWIKEHVVEVEIGETCTEPDHNRTIREILEDAVFGRPSPVPLTPLPADSYARVDKNGKLIEGKDLRELHSLQVQDDKFLGIMNAREKALKSRQKIDSARDRILSSARKQVVEQAKKEAIAAERERARREERPPKE